MTMVTHGSLSSIDSASGVTISPKVPKTTTKPAVSAADTASARTTALAPPARCSLPRNAER